MRTTVDIDDDVLQAAKELAEFHGITAGKMLSELARKGMTPATTARVRNGVPLIPARPGGRKITMELVNQLRDEE